LCNDEVRASRTQSDAVDREIVLDPLQLRVREVVCVPRALEARVELLDLDQNALSFGLLRTDRRVGGSCAGRKNRCGDSNDDSWGVSFQNPNDVSRRSPGTRHRVPFRHKVRTLAGLSDARNR
jgi:hypothetical protein